MRNTSTCDDGFYFIETREECEAAASYIEHSDTSAFEVPGVYPHGCWASADAAAGLVFNAAGDRNITRLEFGPSICRKFVLAVHSRDLLGSRIWFSLQPAHR